MCANFGLLLLSHTLYISPTTHNPFSTSNTMSVSTQYNRPASSQTPTIASKSAPIQRFGLNPTEPDIVIHPYSHLEEGRVRTRVQEAARKLSASHNLTEVREVVKRLARPHKTELRKELKSGTGNMTAWTKIVGEAMKGYCGKTEASITVCHTFSDFQQVVADNPELVDEKSAKTGEVTQHLSEAPTAPEDSPAEEKFLGYYDSDPGQCEDGDSNDGEETVSHKIRGTNRGWDSD
jgi:hypothetical protein